MKFPISTIYELHQDTLTTQPHTTITSEHGGEGDDTAEETLAHAGQGGAAGCQPQVEADGEIMIDARRNLRD